MEGVRSLESIATLEIALLVLIAIVLVLIVLFKP
jgi:hypothetical protein